jgi:outer membrane protein assembly factor BamB
VNENAGLGYSGFSIVNGVLYTLGLYEQDEKLIAMDVATGKKLWDLTIGGRLKNNWGDGPRSTPTVSGGLVFALGGNGDLVCADAKTGKKEWDKSLTKDLGGVIQSWGYTESPLVEGDLVIVTPGGSKGTLAALSTKNGAVKWQTADYTENAQYASPIAINHAGKRQIVQLVMNSFVGVSVEDGKQLWKAEFPGRTAVIPTPIYREGYVYVAAGYGVGCKMIKLGEGTPETVYENKTMTNHPKYLYGHSESARKNGHEKWSERPLPRAAYAVLLPQPRWCWPMRWSPMPLWTHPVAVAEIVFATMPMKLRGRGQPAQTPPKIRRPCLRR